MASTRDPLFFENYVSAPGMVIGGAAHGTAFPEGESRIVIMEPVKPWPLYVREGERPFVMDQVSTTTKAIPIEMIHFRIPFAIDTTDGLNTEAILGSLNKLVRKFQGELMTQVYNHEHPKTGHWELDG